MEFDQKINLQEIDSDENSGFDVRSLIDKYLRYWKWFVLTFIISVAIAYYKLNFIRPQYEAVTTIKMKDEKGSDKSTLSVFQDIGIMGGSKNNIEDEIEIFKIEKFNCRSC